MNNELKRPDKDDDKYNLVHLMTIENGVKTYPFDHISYEEDLEYYVSEIEKKLEWINVSDLLPPNTETDLNGQKLDFSETILVYGDDIVSLGYYDFELKVWNFEGEPISKVEKWKFIETP